jgi:plasmid stabilization system protein ParE
MRIRLLSLAEQDLLAGFRFYERQSTGVGSYFLDTLYSEIDSLVLYAGIHHQFAGYFRLLSRRFPWAVYYKVEAGEIQIWRVLDCRRKPSRILRQLQPRHSRASSSKAGPREDESSGVGAQPPE